MRQNFESGFLKNMWLENGMQAKAGLLLPDSTPRIGLKKLVKLPLVPVTTTAAGGILSWQNPEGKPICITRFLLNVTTGSTGAANGDFGIDDLGDTSNDTLIDGRNMQTTGIADNVEHGGTNGLGALALPAGYFVVGTASATVAGLVGSAYIEYFVL